MPRQRILCITTGGSIDKTYSGEASDFVVGSPAAKALVRSVKCAHNVAFKELMRKDSLELTDEDRNKVLETVRAARETLVVITHGTDTMWKTASALREAALELSKVVVLTGALRPAAFKDTDAAFNLGAALAVVQYLPAGAHVVMNGVVYSDPDKLAKKEGTFFEKEDNNGHTAADSNKPAQHRNHESGAQEQASPGEEDDAEGATVDDPPNRPPYRGRGRGRYRGRGRGRGRGDYANRSRRRAEAPAEEPIE